MDCITVVTSGVEHMVLIIVPSGVEQMVLHRSPSNGDVSFTLVEAIPSMCVTNSGSKRIRHPVNLSVSQSVGGLKTANKP